MDRTELINLVKTRMDEISPFDGMTVDVGIEDNKPLDSLIDSLLNEAAQEVYLKAPFYRLKITKGVTTTPVNIMTEVQVSITPETNGDTGIITVPFDKFGRFVSLRMSDWKRPVTEISILGDDVSKRQIYDGAKGTPSRPVVVLSRIGNDIRLQYYTTKASTHSISEFLFVKKDLPENITDGILINAMLWICAGKIYGIYNNANGAQICNTNAQSLLV